jgi:hypothetical protein
VCQIFLAELLVMMLLHVAYSYLRGGRRSLSAAWSSFGWQKVTFVAMPRFCHSFPSFS